MLRLASPENLSLVAILKFQVIGSPQSLKQLCPATLVISFYLTNERHILIHRSVFLHQCNVRATIDGRLSNLNSPESIWAFGVTIARHFGMDGLSKSSGHLFSSLCFVKAFMERAMIIEDSFPALPGHWPLTAYSSCSSSL